VRLTTRGGRLHATIPADYLALGQVGLSKRLPVWAALFLELARRPAGVPDVDLVLMLMDVVSEPWDPDPAASGAPPLWGEARRANASHAHRAWLVPSFDTFRLAGGDVADVAPARGAAGAERANGTGAFWRGTVRSFAGWSMEEMVLDHNNLNNMHLDDAASGHAFAEPVRARVQFRAVWKSKCS